MAVEKYTVHDGVFVHSGTRASIKDTPHKEFEAGLKKALEESAQRGTTEYILNQLEMYARSRLDAPEPERRRGRWERSFQREKESDTRQRRDCERLLKEISFLKTISGRNETDKDFLMTQFFYLGVLAQQADIRPIESGVFLAGEYAENQKGKAEKPRTRNGMTPAQRRERNEKIVRAFKKSPLNASGFSQKHTSKYGLKPRQIRTILEKALGS